MQVVRRHEPGLSRQATRADARFEDLRREESHGHCGEDDDTYRLFLARSLDSFPPLLLCFSNQAPRKEREECWHLRPQDYAAEVRETCFQGVDAVSASTTRAEDNRAEVTAEHTAKATATDVSASAALAPFVCCELQSSTCCDPQQLSTAAL